MVDDKSTQGTERFKLLGKFSIMEVIKQASKYLLGFGLDSARIDAEVLLGHVLGFDRAQLYMHANQRVDAAILEQFSDLVNVRAAGKPLAYLLGHKEFWSLDFLVTEDTLIPRPETEILVECVLAQISNKEQVKLADLGTGSGAIAIVLAKERPHWLLHATDVSEKALLVASNNAKKHQCDNISFYCGKWCQALPDDDYDLIISNPPYIRENDPHLNDLGFEPKNALISGKDGLDDIRCIIKQSVDYLTMRGFLILEHGFNQSRAVATLMKNQGFKDIKSHADLLGYMRVTLGHL